MACHLAGRSEAHEPRSRSGALLAIKVGRPLVVAGVSLVSAFTRPGPFPASDSVAVLVRQDTPTFYTAVVA